MIEWNTKEWIEEFPFLKWDIDYNNNNKISHYFDFPRAYREDFYNLCNKIKHYYTEENPFILMQIDHNRLHAFYKNNFTIEDKELNTILDIFNQEINKKCFICGKDSKDYDCRRNHQIPYNMCPDCEAKIFD